MLRVRQIPSGSDKFRQGPTNSAQGAEEQGAAQAIYIIGVKPITSLDCCLQRLGS